MADVLGASGIFGFGMGRKRINKLFDDIPDILEQSTKLSTKQLYNKIIKIEGFSEITTKNIVDNLDWAVKFIKALSNFAIFKEKVIIDNNMEGLKVVFSGFRDTELSDKVVARGGKVLTSISKNVNILVVAVKSAKLTGKTKKAEELGITIMGKDEFINKYIDNK